MNNEKATKKQADKIARCIHVLDKARAGLIVDLQPKQYRVPCLRIEDASSQLRMALRHLGYEPRLDNSGRCTARRRT